MQRTLRSVLRPGSPRWAARRAQWRALGLTDADLEKPKIAIVNTSSDLSICFSHLDGIAAEMKKVIRAAGGVPFEIRTAAPSDFITCVGGGGGYVLASRDLIVNDVEVVAEGAVLDGMVCLTSCDKTVPGQLMAAARLNIPTLMVACGYQPSGQYQGEHIDIEEVFLLSNYLPAGKVTVDELRAMSDVAIQGPGVCAGMGTANSMHVVCEALGMALPGTTPILANSPAMWQVVEQAGRRIVEMVWQDLKPRQILTAGAFANAVAAVMAIGGSINTAKHLQAVAREAECPVDVYDLFAQCAGKVPLLVAVRPNGDHLIEDFDAAGGTRALMKQLAGLLDLDVQTVAGQTLGEILRTAPVHDPEVIRPLGRPFMQRPAIVLVRGSLAPEGGLVKCSPAENRPSRFTGRAVVFQSMEEALEGIRQGRVQSGHVLVLRGLGPKGTPGMGMASSVAFALDGAGLSETTAMVTDGQISGLLNRNLVVAEIAPEAAAGGPLALVQDGDEIAIDVDGRSVDLRVEASELAARQERLQIQMQEGRGWLSIYQRLVRPLRDGAVLVDPPRPDR